MTSIAINGKPTPVFARRLTAPKLSATHLSLQPQVVHACKANEQRDALYALYELGCDGVILNAADIPIEQLRDMLDRHRRLVVTNRYVEHFDDRCVRVWLRSNSCDLAINTSP